MEIIPVPSVRFNKFQSPVNKAYEILTGTTRSPMNKSPSLSPKSFRFDTMTKLEKLKENRKENTSEINEDKPEENPEVNPTKSQKETPEITSKKLTTEETPESTD